jgi:capsular exopolysaccharide synthesis family protein
MSRLFEALQISENGRTDESRGAPGAFAFLDAAEKEPKPEIGNVRSLHISPPADSRLVAITEKESLGAEKFRFLAVRLRQARQTRPIKRILVTSSIAEEGKSLTSANLAVTLARKHDQRVLLIEGDLRRPTLSKEMGLGRLPGLSESLKGDATPLKNIYHLKEANTWFLPAGDSSDSTLELMQSPRLPEFLDQVSDLFDWIVIDSPPLLPLADTIIWSRLADGVLLVVRQGKTAKRPLKRALGMLDRSSLLGVVLNGSTNTDHENYYARYGYGVPALNDSAKGKNDQHGYKTTLSLVFGQNSNNGLAFNCRGSVRLDESFVHLWTLAVRFKVSHVPDHKLDYQEATGCFCTMCHS